MTQPTKAQRHELYKKAVEVLGHNIMGNGICAVLLSIKDKISSSFKYMPVTELEEFKMICPLDYSPGHYFTHYWDIMGNDRSHDTHSEEGQKCRKILLQFCIEMTRDDDYIWTDKKGWVLKSKIPSK